MKKYGKITIIAALALLLISCEDFLSTDASSKLTEEKMYSTEGDMYRAVLNIYSRMGQDRVYGRSIPMVFNYNNDIEYGQCNANIDNTRRGIWDHSATSNNEELLAWGQIYTAINCANECIEGIENSALFRTTSAETPSVVRQIYGEAKALRAILYHDLARCWGDVPFTTSGTKFNDEFYMGATSRDTILTHVINDLIEVEPGMLYASELSESVERVNRGAVQGLIARLSLTRGGYALYPDLNDPKNPGTMKRPDDYMDYYRIANKYARKLIDSGKHSLVSEFGDVFKNQCQEIYPSNDDMLFEFPFATSYNGYVGVVVGHKIEGNSNIPYGRSDGWYYATLPYHASFDYQDIRRDVTCAPYKWQWSSKTGQIEQVYTEWRSIYIGKWNKLWMKEQQGANVQYNSGINWPVIRYADVLLMLAETENEINQSPTEAARTALAEVRKRAFPSELRSEKVDNYVNGLISYDAFFEAIINERAWEFGGESIRKYDLIRWNMLREKLIEMKTNLANMYDNGAYPQYVYIKTLSDGTLDIKNLDNSIISAPAGYERKTWAAGVLDGNGDLNTTYVKSFKDDYITPEPMVYIFPYYKDVITDSRGKLQNYYGKQ